MTCYSKGGSAGDEFKAHRLASCLLQRRCQSCGHSSCLPGFVAMGCDCKNTPHDNCVHYNDTLQTILGMALERCKTFNGRSTASLTSRCLQKSLALGLQHATSHGLKSCTSTIHIHTRYTSEHSSVTPNGQTNSVPRPLPLSPAAWPAELCARSTQYRSKN